MSKSNSAFESEAGRFPAFLSREESLQEFVHAWELGTLPRSSWTHPAHVAAAAYYAFDLATGDCFSQMKKGILHYAACTGIVHTEDSGYHETVTRFWASLVSEFVLAHKFRSRIEAARAAVAEFGDDRNRYRLYYTFDIVKDRRARREWVPPDRKSP